MSRKKYVIAALLTLTVLLAVYVKPVHSQSASPRNVIIFVADGLRAGSINATDAPTMMSIRQNGVFFQNSHSLFPTFTMPNGSAIATSHYLGDTGTFSNALFAGFPIFNTGNFGNATGTQTPFIESDQVLGDIDDHFSSKNYLNEETLLALARQNGYSTAAVGKNGPTALQDVTETNPQSGAFVTPTTVIIDDNTGRTSSSGVLLSPPLPADIATALNTAGLGVIAPNRSNNCGATAQCNNGFSGNNATPGTTSANLVQQQYFADAVTKAILPTFVANSKPFALVFWSRDPDGSEHNQGDSLNSLTPGINGATSKAAVNNADNNLKQILQFLADNNLTDNTDVFVTADHGFATISRHEIDAAGHFTSSYAAHFTYKDSTGRQEVNSGFLPPGFLAIDLAHSFHLPLFDPDSQITNSANVKVYEPVDPSIAQQTATVRQHPANSDGLIGGSGAISTPTDAKIVVAANGGSDLIYVPDHKQATVQKIVQFLAGQDYVGGIFVDDQFGNIPGALPLSAINLKGSTGMPTPAVVVNFKSFALDPGNPNQSAVQIADTGLQEGQGMHGTLSRDNTFNNMAAMGPDFKQSFVDPAPVSNADIALTLVQVLGLNLPTNGTLQGRVLVEALTGGPASVTFQSKQVQSSKASGTATFLRYQETTSGQKYFDSACLGSSGACK